MLLPAGGYSKREGGTKVWKVQAHDLQLNLHLGKNILYKNPKIKE